MHIENRAAHRKWELNQAENYRKRAFDGVKPGRHADFQTMLMAPAWFIDQHPIEAANFDIKLSYENADMFVPEFLLDVIEAPSPISN